jgi:dihydrofolate reductase
MKPFNLIVAIDQKNGIGKQGKLPWALSGDMQHFKAITLKTDRKGYVNAVVMGRRTWESIPQKFRPLTKRFNIVLTKNDRYALPEGVLSAQSLERAIEVLGHSEEERQIDHIFVIGGASVYQEAIEHPLCQKIYLTNVEGDFLCDAFFPEFKKNFKQVDASPSFCEKGITYSFCTYVRR